MSQWDFAGIGSIQAAHLDGPLSGYEFPGHAIDDIRIEADSQRAVCGGCLQHCIWILFSGFDFGFNSVALLDGTSKPSGLAKCAVEWDGRIGYADHTNNNCYQVHALFACSAAASICLPLPLPGCCCCCLCMPVCCAPCGLHQSEPITVSGLSL